MATIQIRDIPDDVYDEYRRQARAAGQSLQAYMREQMIEAAETRARRVAALRRMEEFLDQDGALGLTAEQIMADLDADRR